MYQNKIKAAGGANIVPANNLCWCTYSAGVRYFRTIKRARTASAARAMIRWMSRERSSSLFIKRRRL